ncbi:MAG: hypothetical protein HUU55_00675 [Myxococcales bacterium]|nr:hypothetical protein [Myxococcales bacterium]
MDRTWRWIWAMALALLGCTESATAEVVKAFSGSDKKIETADLVPNLPDAENGTVKYTFEAYFPDNISIYWSSRLFNFGPGDGKCEAKSRLEIGSRKMRHSNDLDKGDYKITAQPLELVFQDHVLSGGPDGIRIVATGKEYSYDLVFKPTVKNWRPGNGRVDFGGAGFFDTLLIPPKGTVEGTITVDGETKQVKGSGYGTMSRSSIAPHDMAKRWLEFRVVRGNTVVFFKEFLTPNRFGDKSIGWLLVAHKGKVLVATSDYTVEYGDFVTDEKSSQKYRVPQALIIKAKNGENELTLGIKGTKQKDRDDVLANMNAIERAIVSKFAKPITYNYSAAFEVRYTGANPITDTGKGAVYDISHINP